VALLLDSFFSGRAYAPGDRIIEFEDVGLGYADFLTHVETLAARIRGAAGPGARVALSLPSTPLFVWALLATARAGGEVVLLNPLMSPERAASLAAVAGADLVVSTGSWPGGLSIGLDELLEPVGRDPVNPIADAADSLRAVTLLTSGSSGEPKVVRLPQVTLTSALRRHVAFGLEARPERFTTIVKPLYHMSGIWNCLVAFARNRRLALQQKFEPQSFAAMVERLQLTRASLTTSMIIMLSERMDELRPALRTLKVVRVGAMPLPLEVRVTFEEQLDCLVLDAYGQTETCGEIAGWIPQLVDQVGRDHPDRRAGGGLHPGVEIRVQKSDGSLSTTGEGEICVRAPGFAQTVNGQPVLERSGDGFHHTGDIGYVDERSLLFVLGRRDRMINRGGFSISPEVIEDWLLRQPAVTDAVVVGVPDHRLGQVPVALVVARPRSEVDTDELLGSTRRELGAYMAPKRVLVVPELPRLPSGKLDLQAAATLAQTQARSQLAAASRPEHREASST
jgi:long-chain acyl-CoA synthetase